MLANFIKPKTCLPGKLKRKKVNCLFWLKLSEQVEADCKEFQISLSQIQSVLTKTDQYRRKHRIFTCTA